MALVFYDFYYEVRGPYTLKNYKDEFFGKILIYQKKGKNGLNMDFLVNFSKLLLTFYDFIMKLGDHKLQSWIFREDSCLPKKGAKSAQNGIKMNFFVNFSKLCH